MMAWCYGAWGVPKTTRVVYFWWCVLISQVKLEVLVNLDFKTWSTLPFQEWSIMIIHRMTKGDFELPWVKWNLNSLVITSAITLCKSFKVWWAPWMKKCFSKTEVTQKPIKSTKRGFNADFLVEIYLHCRIWPWSIWLGR